ncbi:MAG: hypothetical protein ABIP79_16535 [Chitinophagaceae bacterium]
MELYFDKMDNLVNLKKLVDSGIALIPVNHLKEPYAPFKGKNRLGFVELIDAIRYYSQQFDEVQRVAVRCGKVSGNFICIDVDSKHKAGISERIYSDFKEIFSDLWDKFRIEKTPSGGLHIYYRIEDADGVDIKGCNPARRVATGDELVLDPKRKEYFFIEVKASDGSTCTVFPSVGYSLIKEAASDGMFGLIPIADHIRIIEFLYLYDEVVKTEITKISSVRSSFYQDGQSPFDQFNLSEKGSEVLDELGWKRYKISGGRITYIKPEKKDNGVGATFNLDRRTYAIFTTNSGIATKCYNPSSLLCSEKFGSDWGLCYEYLVGLGYGKLKDFVEKAEIKKAIKSGSDLPANISKDGREKFDIEVKRKGEKYQYGEFWLEGEKEGDWEINRELICRVCNDMGFRSYRNTVVLIDDWRIKEVDEDFFFNYLKSYMDTEDIALLDLYEEFLQKSGKFTISRLGKLKDELILISNKKESYKFFKNCYICITKDGYSTFTYDDLNGYKVWEKDIKDREFNFISSFNRGLYWNFIKNAIGWDQYLMKCIGFYSHDFRDEESYLIVTTEKCENPKDGGGSGKNIFWKLFGLTTSFKSVAASMIRKDTQFLQSWKFEKVFIMADMPKGFDLVFFKDMIDQGAVVKKLYKDEFDVEIADMAKFGASSNFSVDDSDPGIKRRLRLIEFTDFYTKVDGGVKTYHEGKMFPKDWDEDEYLLFDNIIAACIQEYLICESIINPKRVSDTGWAKKQEQVYKHLYDFVKGNIDNWVYAGKVSSKKLNEDYTSFRMDSNIQKALSAFTINKAIEDYCAHFSIGFVHTYRKENGEMSDGVVWKENGVSVKGRYFGEEAKKFLEKRGEAVMVSEDVEELPF